LDAARYYEGRVVDVPSWQDVTTDLKKGKVSINELVEHGRMSIYRALHEVGYDDGEFVRCFQAARREFPYSVELAITLSLSGIAIGQYWNGFVWLQQLADNVATASNNSYEAMLPGLYAQWTNLIYSSSETPLREVHRRARRIVSFAWGDSLRSHLENGTEDRSFSDSFALMNLRLGTDRTRSTYPPL